MLLGLNDTKCMSPPREIIQFVFPTKLDIHGRDSTEH
jgi:hypothetical protein